MAKLLGPNEMNGMQARVYALANDIDRWVTFIINDFNSLPTWQRQSFGDNSYSAVLRCAMNYLDDKGTRLRLSDPIHFEFPLSDPEACASLTTKLKAEFAQAGWGDVSVEFKRTWLLRFPRVIIRRK